MCPCFLSLFQQTDSEMDERVSKKQKNKKKKRRKQSSSEEDDEELSSDSDRSYRKRKKM